MLLWKYFSKNDSVLDIGVYPGVVPQIFHEYYPSNNNYKYFGLGLGFEDDFVKSMHQFNVKTSWMWFGS